MQILFGTIVFNDMNDGIQSIIFIVALVFCTGFLVLIIVLVPALRELRNLFVELQKTSLEVRGLVEEAKKISANVEGKLEGIDGILASSQKIMSNISAALGKVNFKFMKYAELLALVPAILWGINKSKKMKRRKDE